MQPKSSIPESGEYGQSATSFPSSVGGGNGSLSDNSLDSRGGFKSLDGLSKSTTELSNANLTEIKARLGARVTAARESLEKVGGEIADRARKAATATDTYVHAQPWKAVGIGAAAGFLLSLIFARRTSSKTPLQ